MTDTDHATTIGAPLHSLQHGLAGIRIRVSNEEFLRLLDLADDPLVAKATGGFGIRVLTFHSYAFPYRGFVVRTFSRQALALPEHVEVIEAKSIH